MRAHDNNETGPTVRELLPSLRQALSVTYNETVNAPTPESVSEIHTRLREHLGHEPHDDLLAWYELASLPCEVVPWIEIPTVEAQLARWEEYLGYRETTREIEDPKQLLVNHTDGNQDLCPVASTTGASETWIVSPTRLDAELPRICAVGYYETAFFYAKPDDGNAITKLLSPEASAQRRLDTPTLRHWTHIALLAHQQGRFTRQPTAAKALDITTDTGSKVDARPPVPDAVYRYPWPIYAPAG